MARIKNHYINNADFLQALKDHKQKSKEHQEQGLPLPRIPEYIGECIMKIANNLAKRPNFYAYTYIQECISDGIENCLVYINNFDSEKYSNPFAYFTQICWYAFVRRIHKEKKQQYIKCRATENFGVLGDEELQELDDDIIQQIQVYDNMYELMEAFESKIKEKKEKVKKKKGIELFLEDEDEREITATLGYARVGNDAMRRG